NPLRIVRHRTGLAGEGADDVPQGGGPGRAGAPVRLIPIQDARAAVPPPPAEQHVARPTVVRMTHLDPAMLIYRVDPLYPVLPKQMHKEGRVELHARIATDGSM